MDLGNVRKYDIETLKSLHNELNESNVQSGGWIITATDEKIYTIFEEGRLVVTSRFTYHPTDTPTYCTSPYRPNLVEWKNGNSQDGYEIEEEKELELVTTTITKKSPITTTFNELNTFFQASSMTTPPPFHETTDNKLEETKKFSSVYFDESFTKYHQLISAVEMPRFKLCVLIRYSLGMLITRCKEIWNRLPVKTDLDILAKEIVEYYPSLSKKAVRKKLGKRFVNLKANANKAEKREEEKKSSNKLVDRRPSSLVEQQEQAAVSECCLEDDTKTSSNNDDDNDDDNLSVFPIGKAYCDFDLSNIVYGRRLRGGKRRCGKKEKEER